jgi:hypothetical protein
MARAIPSLFSLNRGVVDRRGLARADVKRLALAAQVQTNWMPKVLGPMMLRVGFAYLGGILNSAPARFLKFIFATDDLAELELTDSSMRIWIGDTVLTRAAVTTTITNGTFDTDLTGWTSFDGAGATSSWVAPGYLQLQGNGTNRAVREQHVTNASANNAHGIRIVIARGPVYMRIGSSSGADDLLSETVLYTGTHSIEISPGVGDFYIRFFSSASQVVWVDSCTIEAAGAVVVPTPWTASDLNNVRYDQSADVLFVACKGRQQRRIERRGARPGGRGWSVVLYQSPDGPFMLQNTGPITLAASAITGNITVTASQPLFKTTHVGALFSITSVGQQTTVAAAGANTFSPSIRVTGLAAQRGFGIVITGTFVATVVLQQSFDNATWADVAGKSWTAPTSTTYSDGLDNQIVYYRIGVEAAYTSGTANATLTFSQGSIRGIVRITGYTTSTSVSAEVLTSLGGTAASTVWEEGKWSDLRGWPTAVGIHEGRMWWAGQNGMEGSLSDAFDSFDETFAGDAGAIDRTVGSGPVDTINWILSLKGMLVGAQGAEYSVRSSSLDEPLTPTNFNLKASSTQGSGAVGAVKVDQMGYFVDRTGCKLYELAFDIRNYDYTSVDIMELAPEIGLPGIVRIDVQRKPDTRVHMVRSDGTAIVCVLNAQEEVRAMIPITTSGFIEDVVVQPAVGGNLDDQVYYVVRRTINGATVRYREKWAQETECRGDQQLCKLADSHLAFSGASNVFAVPHLIGQSVVVWADGADVGTDDSSVTWVQRYTVDGSGNVTLPSAYTNVVIGLPYTAQFQSAKLGVQSTGSMLNPQKKIGHLGLILADTHRRGVRFGPSFDYLDDMPQIENGTLVTQEVEADYDENLIEFPGTWTTDMRVCVVGAAPRPATVMAITIDEVQNS